jgi:sulfatase maturation enzyme AslB (radical SAM superfamily)
MSKRFSQIYCEITNVCNMNCVFCPGTMREPVFMSYELFEKAARQAQPLCDQIYLHLMGEPLLHPDLGRILAFCRSIDLPVSVTTNGSLLEEKESLLLDGSVRQINISLHAHDPFSAETMILPFVRRAMIENPLLYINLRLWNLDSFDSASSEVRLNAERIRAIERVLNVSADIEALAWKKGRLLSGRIYLHRDTVFSWPGDADEKSEGFCHGLGMHCGILADGTVVPCCLDRDGEIALGSIIEQDLLDILASPRAVAMRDGFAFGRLVEDLCRHCSFCRRFGVRI